MQRGGLPNANRFFIQGAEVRLRETEGDNSPIQRALSVVVFWLEVVHLSTKTFQLNGLQRIWRHEVERGGGHH